ncbi:unnamed protein product [Durusdinium trenchii]|uniref:Uncharacterized protein n=1 Tax=Durusdinium trenchii TaxID=1381693 RepID=A0ABP0L8F7_9DINO
MLKPVDRRTSSQASQDLAPFLEESKMTLTARSLRMQLETSEACLQEEEAETQQLRQELILRQEVFAADAAREMWEKSQKSRLQSRSAIGRCWKWENVGECGS